MYNRRGTLWGERFKSVIVQNGETLVSCLGYRSIYFVLVICQTFYENINLKNIQIMQASKLHPGYFC